MSRPVLLTGDAISQLLQQIAAEVDLDLRPSGVGKTDLKMLVVRCYNAELRTDMFAMACEELMEAVKKGELPEAAAAVITTSILAAKAAYEQQKKT